MKEDKGKIWIMGKRERICENRKDKGRKESISEREGGWKEVGIE